jgi:hypothetical protein
MNNQRGTVFFYILIGVALFAALSYAVSQSIRLSNDSSGLATGQSEKMNLALVELRNAAMEARIAIQTLTIEGSNQRQLNLYASGPDGVYYPWSSPYCTGDRCNLYSPTGYGLKFFLFSKVYPQFSGRPNVVDGFQYPQGLYLAAWADKGSLQADIIYRVNVTKNFCNFINKQIGITSDIDSFGTPSLPATQYVIRGDDTSGLAAASNFWAFGGDAYPPFNKKNEFCYRLGAAPPHQYIYVFLVYPY